jgi:predicted AlkP superfamily phosphohydrolase/phosphomutase
MPNKNQKNKVFILGIDGFVPDLVFNKYRKYLPNFSKLMAEGSYADLDSTIPPTSIVAWTSLASGRDPAETGIHSYTSRPKQNSVPFLTNSKNIKVPLLWDILTKNKKKAIALNIPLTYPAKKINGLMVTDFLTPSFDDQSIYPISLKKTIKKLTGGKDYIFDVAGFTGYKKMELDRLIKSVYEMTDMNLQVGKHLFEKEEWDLFFMVLVGSDRLHHMFWKHLDPKHIYYKPDSKYKNVVLDYYKYLDKNLGEWLKSKKIDEKTTIIITSDHGMDRMDCRINLNDWLIKNGYLKLKKESAVIYSLGPKRLNNSDIDWRHSTALASGGYQGRIYLLKKNNKKALTKTLISKLQKIKGPQNQKLDTKVFDTSKIYKKQDPEAPEIIIYFDNLRYGINNDVGNNGLYSMGTTVGIDDAGHAPEGTFIIKSAELKNTGNLGNINILQIAPTVLKILKLKEYKKLPNKPLN